MCTALHVHPSDFYCSVAGKPQFTQFDNHERTDHHPAAPPTKSVRSQSNQSDHRSSSCCWYTGTGTACGSAEYQDNYTAPESPCWTCVLWSTDGPDDDYDDNVAADAAAGLGLGLTPVQVLLGSRQNNENQPQLVVSRQKWRWLW